jgi:excisionase family DNA binding protein
MEEFPRWLTPDQAAKYLQVSRGSLNNLVRQGAIPKPKALSARIVRYDREAIDATLGGVTTAEQREPRLGDIKW